MGEKPSNGRIAAHSSVPERPFKLHFQPSLYHMGAEVSRIASLCPVYHGEVVLTLESSEYGWEVFVHQGLTKTPFAIEKSRCKAELRVSKGGAPYVHGHCLASEKKTLDER